MGRKAKLRQERQGQNRTQEIRVAGEAAEAFDLQMDTDRAWFEQNEKIVCLRPSIDGEWDTDRVVGCRRAAIGPSSAPDCWVPSFFDEADFLWQEATWAAIVDVGRLMAKLKTGEIGPPSGFRIRTRCIPPLTPRARELAELGAMVFAVETLQQHPGYASIFSELAS